MAYAFDEDKSKVEITVSNTEPTDNDGNDGDIWFVYDDSEQV